MNDTFFKYLVGIALNFTVEINFAYLILNKNKYYIYII